MCNVELAFAGKSVLRIKSEYQCKISCNEGKIFSTEMEVKARI
jgi:hypothetical protein